ncbi:carboxyl transferase domain-containing protein [Corynebacterium sp. H78]|uniref:carboxyl transferase domain-containing protein n=1 Tax=Corynebacterium sp. H78 TaxID=3133417 RepID=UPI0030B0105C
MSRTSAKELIHSVLDHDSYISWDTPPEHGDISAEYRAALDRAMQKTGVDEAVLTGEGTVKGKRVAFICSEFSFLGGSIGAATARRIIHGIERATRERLPLLISPTSGGTRMQEGTPAFAMMVSITTAVARHKDEHLPFLVYLRNPTTGGVMASWGSSGHFTFAEPEALLGFLGPRVVELTTGVPMPDGVQTSENLFEHGIIDGVISPEELRGSVRRTIDILTTNKEPSEPKPVAVVELEGRDTWEAILRTRDVARPGGGAIIEALIDRSVPLSGTGDGHRGLAIQARLARIGERPVILIAQDRHNQPPLGQDPMGPSSLRFAQRAIRLAESLAIPVVTVIDTAGAELTQYAEENAMAGEIARTLTTLLDVRVPTVSLILGQGCGGGALALLPADRAMAMHDAWLSPLPPEGASAIIYRDTDHAPEMMEEQGVSAEALLTTGVIDQIIEEPSDLQALPNRALQAIEHALWTLETAPERVGRDQRFAHYRSFALGDDA